MIIDNINISSLTPADRRTLSYFQKHYQPPTSPGACSGWTGQRYGQGRAYVKNGGRTTPAARWLYKILHPEVDLNGLVVRHLCDDGRGNILCCNPSHLALGTQSQNTQDALKAGQFPMGEKNYMAKLDTAAVVRIRCLQRGGYRTQEALAEDYKVSRGLIYQVWAGLHWKHIPGSRSNPFTHRATVEFPDDP